MKYCACLTLVLLATGCGYWGRRPVDEWTDISRDDPVWIWTKGGLEKWHDVFITEDSISGIPWKSGMAAGHWCTMCRRSIPRAQVDSMKLGYKPTVQKVIEGVGGVSAFILLWAGTCSVLAPHDREC